jgi:hypothetical protein
MVHAKRTTRTTGATGENLVSNALMQCLDWIPRKEELDEGIDFNVEIPADPPHPGRRFLTQVKTKSRFSDRKDGSWTVAIRGAIARKYRSLREPVFLFAVDLQRNEIRWANMLAALQVAPELRTFTLRPAHILKPDTACELRSAVLAAFDEADDQYHPPLQAVRYRAQKLEGLNPGFTVKGAVVDGIERYEFGLRSGGALRVTLKTRTSAAAKMLQEAHDFGSRAELTVRSEDITGLPALPHPRMGESLLRIEAQSRRFRLGMTSRSGDGSPLIGLEFDAELSRGAVGWEVRSADPSWPFMFRVTVSDQEHEGQFVFLWDDRPWEGQPLAQLPGLVPLQKLAAMLSRPGTLVFDWIDFGERHTMMSLVIQPECGESLKGTLDRFAFYRQVAELCRSLSFDAVYRAEDALTETQFQNLTLAFQLLQQSPIPFNGQRYPIIPTEEGKLALRASNPVSLTLQMSLELSHGQTVLGRMPVRSIVHKFTVSDNPDGILIVEANEADLMWDREEQKMLGAPSA